MARSRKESVDKYERSLELLYFRLTSPEITAHDWHAVMELQEPLRRDARFVPITTAAEGVAYDGGQAALRAVEGQACDHRGIYSARG